MPDSPMIIPLHDCEDLSLCGGKAINLSRMIRAGLPVPEGFVISTNAYRHWQPDVAEVPESLAEEIAAAYRQLGSPAVAVRSSATAEDLAEASMAGQYETFLDVRGADDLLTAVQHCWQSMGAERLQDRGLFPLQTRTRAIPWCSGLQTVRRSKPQPNSVAQSQSQ